MNRERLEKIKAAYGQPMKDGNYPDEMIAEIEKCWAITELAVKELKEIHIQVPWGLRMHIRETLDEIARLQNAQT